VNINLNISVPVLLAGQGFRIRHREQFTTPWTDDGVFTVQNPLITGLTEGICYEFEITFLSSVSPLVECGPAYQIICVPEEQPCIELSYTYEKTQNYYTITLNFSTPSPAVLPCGGYKMYYGPVSSPQTFTIVTFPFFPTTSVIPVANTADWIFYIYAIDCEGNEFLCDTLIAEYEAVPCTAAVITDVELVNTNGVYSLVITVTPSIPNSNTYVVTYWQCQAVSTGVADGGTVNQNSTNSNPEIFTIPINPNLSGVGGRITYCGTVTDNCNNSRNFDISLPI
jgi:hypothetical protein